MQPGDKLLLTSDGLLPADTESGATGAARLREAVDGRRGLPVRAFVDRVAHDLAQQSSARDDVTLLALERMA